MIFILKQNLKTKTTLNIKWMEYVLTRKNNVLLMHITASEGWQVERARGSYIGSGRHYQHQTR